MKHRCNYCGNTWNPEEDQNEWMKIYEFEDTVVCPFCGRQYRRQE